MKKLSFVLFLLILMSQNIFAENEYIFYFEVYYVDTGKKEVVKVNISDSVAITKLNDVNYIIPSYYLIQTNRYFDDYKPLNEVINKFNQNERGFFVSDGNYQDFIDVTTVNPWNPNIKYEADIIFILDDKNIKNEIILDSFKKCDYGIYNINWISEDLLFYQIECWDDIYIKKIFNLNGKMIKSFEDDSWELMAVSYGGGKAVFRRNIYNQDDYIIRSEYKIHDFEQGIDIRYWEDDYYTIFFYFHPFIILSDGYFHYDYAINDRFGGILNSMTGERIFTYQDIRDNGGKEIHTSFIGAEIVE